MELPDIYFETKNRLFLVCGLLITWDFFRVSDVKESEVDFEILNLSLSRDAIPFLLSFLILYYTYNVAFHWKTKNNGAHSGLQYFDYYSTMVVAVLCCMTNYVYLLYIQNTGVPLTELIEPQIWGIGIIPVILLSYVSNKEAEKGISIEDQDLKKAVNWNKKMNITYRLTLLTTIIWIVYMSWLLIHEYHVSISKSIYFGFYITIVVIVFLWAMYPSTPKENNE